MKKNMKKLATLLIAATMLATSATSVFAAPAGSKATSDDAKTSDTVIEKVDEVIDSEEDTDNKEDGEKYLKKIIELYSNITENGVVVGSAIRDDAYAKVLYSYFDKDNKSDIPNWILIHANSGNNIVPGDYRVFGDYVVYGYDMTFDLCGLFIYTPSDDKIYTLRAAIDCNVANDINTIFEKGIVGRPLGDSDNDNKLSIMDATKIQRCLANIDQWPGIMYNGGFDYDSIGCQAGFGPCHIADFDRDGKVTIIDATRIQQRLAGLI